MFAPEPHRTAEGVVAAEDVLAQQRAIDGRIQLDVRVTGMEVCDTLDRVGPHRRHRAAVAQLRTDVPQQPLVAGDHDLRRPALGANSE